MLMAGLTPAYIAAQLGHSIQVLFERYAKWLDGASNAREQEKLMIYLGSPDIKQDTPSA